MSTAQALVILGTIYIASSIHTESERKFSKAIGFALILGSLFV